MPANDGSARAPASVRDEVLRSIARGDLRPGSPLPVHVLAARTSASPEDVVAALDELVEIGVARVAGGAVVVAETGPDKMADADEVRHIIEEVAVRRFVRQATQSQINALGRALAEVERVAAEPEPSLEQLIRARDWFFVVLLRAGGLATRDLLRRLRSHAGLVMSLAVAGQGRPAELVEELRAVHRALAARDADAAVAACDEHRRNSTVAGLRQLGATP
ncbi:FCD domain-containing protein [Pseudonocardia thermophila]|uniref:FCD domain-containing protein n=1 Tax=Pseudonocardia thermophila TaxID=1848 RepID=UPI00248E2241|nr:FCD domain-containing protein [Pseudonocardia thermophila]